MKFASGAASSVLLVTYALSVEAQRWNPNSDPRKGSSWNSDGHSDGHSGWDPSGHSGWGPGGGNPGWTPPNGGPCSNGDMVVVDLGYERHAGLLNGSPSYYNFSNIRYAQPPVGNLRFALPVAPQQSSSNAIEYGNVSRICPQAQPSWSAETRAFVPAYFSGANLAPFASAHPPGSNATLAQVDPVDPRQTEDCLFLDVMVPTQVYNAGCSRNPTLAPVLIWVYGGGFTVGSKNVIPRGFFRQSAGMVFVSFNYRLGAFGWLSGPEFQKEGLPNAGLYDQKLAFQWVQDNIHKFGGDKNRVTVMGESAGGSSILHHITANGGNGGDAPFQQALLQSPAFAPVYNTSVEDHRFNNFLQYAKASSVADLRAADTQTLMAANQQAVFNSPYGERGFGPAIDGDYVTDLPGVLLSQGKMASGIKNVMTGHNSREGLIFVNPAVQTSSAAATFLRDLFPQASDSVLNQIDQLYPDVFNNPSLPYHDEIGRLSAILGDFVVVCNTYYALTAFGVDKSYGYYFAEGLGLHTEDIPYTFYDNVTTPDQFKVGNVSAPVALTLQAYIANFVATGDPNKGTGPMTNIAPFPVYGTNQNVPVLNGSAVHQGIDPLNKAKCQFWQQALYR